MEEFKNLKEIIELSEEEIKNNDENVSAVLDLVDLKELRNLIARYKDLEKLAEGIEKIRDITIPAKTDFIIVMRENYLPYIKNDFIQKSKVKEKIEELNLKLAEDVNGKIDATYNIRFTIQVLEELLVLED